MTEQSWILLTAPEFSRLLSLRKMYENIAEVSHLAFYKDQSWFLVCMP